MRRVVGVGVVTTTLEELGQHRVTRAAEWTWAADQARRYGAQAGALLTAPAYDPETWAHRDEQLASMLLAWRRFVEQLHQLGWNQLIINRVVDAYADGVNSQDEDSFEL